MGLNSTIQLKRVLVTNDDGIDAPGLKIAELVAAKIAEEVWTVAPAADYSGGSRQLSLHKALRLHEYGKQRYALTGSPADCVMIGVGSVLNKLKPDLIISGVNSGFNIGGDVGFSGTVGAAMTANVLGIPAVALSQGWQSRDAIPWENSEFWLPKVMKFLIQIDLWPWEFVPNVNIPHCDLDSISGIRASRSGRSTRTFPAIETRIDLRNQKYYWLYLSKQYDEPDPDEDISVLQENFVSISPIGRNATDEIAYKMLERLTLIL